jgi:hypothetical protein
MSLESACQSDQPALYGDLSTAPKPERRLFNQDTHALEWIIPHAGSDKLFFIQVLRDAQALLEAELSSSDPFVDSLLVQAMGHQFRTRPDLSHAMLAVEQWVPALDCWLVNGYFPFDTPIHHIIRTLEAGDPRKQTPLEALEESREQAAAIRKSNEAASSAKVLGAVDALTSRQVENFVAVEQALHTGENITVRGQDRTTIERLVADTKKAAYTGDLEAQSVMTRGQRDNPTCALPTTNPLRHRHRSELTTGQGGPTNGS